MALLFQLRTYAALRARLAACLIVAFLAMGLFDVVAYRGMVPRPAAAQQMLATRGASGLAPVGPQQIRALRRHRPTAARAPRYEEIREAAPTVQWPDLEKGVPGVWRFSICKIPSHEDAAGEDADRDAPATGYSSRAPPALT